ncbi:adenosylcobalamin-dependent ribonucleoside-diphosphate reductase [Candidatus Spongiihabitans sp.]|uniref:adenosylcobalamin-dependent ribonucleoside-diphosphate reductase n=1 Tax=Candidatus Spongiihabitans sp. TaxID=3101308 RepID=UPI003C700683
MANLANNKSAIGSIIKRVSVDDIPLQPASLDIWDKKYRLKSITGDPLDQDIDATYDRVAKSLAEVEVTKPKQQEWHDKFLWALKNGAIPAGRITSNAGALAHKPATSTINCTVSGTIPDSMDGVLRSVHEAGMTLKAGCGIGYEFSTLRPKGAFVSGAGAYTSGPLSFMDIFDSMCFTVSSAGGRRGAQMGAFDISHPDILEFVRAKRENGRLRQFNLSCLITDEFMQAVNDDAEWKLYFPATQQETKSGEDEIIMRPWPQSSDYTTNELGQVACRVYNTIPAKQLWNLIMNFTYDYAEPGFILVDRINEMNNNWFCENIRATNPCGEQPLPPYGACLLGSVNLTRFVDDPFTDAAKFDWDKYCEVVAIFCRMLDNVVEVNGLPLEKQSEEILSKRRHGMGFLGLGSTLTMLKMKYGDESSLKFTERVAEKMATVGWEIGVQLAEEKGVAPILDLEYPVTNEMLAMRPEMKKHGYRPGDTVKGSVLMGKYSRYMQQFPQQLQNQIAVKGCRYTHHTSIAPTGTISLSLGNNVSNGIEPTFAHSYSRNVIREGKKSKEKVDVLSYELLAYRHLVNPQAAASVEDKANALPDYFVTADDITPKQHVDVQAAAQKWIDSSISKTANVPTDFAFEDFQGIYQYAWEKGLKGCTTFRFNPEAFQGVLVKEQDLENTKYQFTLENGEIVEVKGNEEIEYDGEIHTAANLFDALKEGYYGRF